MKSNFYSKSEKKSYRNGLLRGYALVNLAKKPQSRYLRLGNKDFDPLMTIVMFLM